MQYMRVWMSRRSSIRINTSSFDTPVTIPCKGDSG